jgi:hypothetical protein
MMRVWVVCEGESNEGQAPESVHATLEGARKAALAIKPVFSGGWDEIEENYWENGCDVVRIESFEVQS